MMNKTQLEEEIFFPFNTGMPDSVLAWLLFIKTFVCVCMCKFKEETQHKD